MCRFRWVLVVLLILSLLAFGSAGWAEGKHGQQKDKDGWDDQWDKRHDDQPPGWDKGKKTGWRGRDLPPGQQKKYRQRHEGQYDWPRDAPRQAVTPVPIPR